MKQINKEQELKKEIEEYLKGKEMKATFENKEIAKSIFGDLLYNQTDVINAILFFAVKREKDILEVIYNLWIKEGIILPFRFEELKQKIKGADEE